MGTPAGRDDGDAGLGWLGILRLGLAQTALGAIVVLTTSTLNRVMVVELALPAMVPGLLVAIHHAVQMLRPRWGYGSDRGGRRTPWIVGGMAVLGVGGVLAALAVALMGEHLHLGLALGVVAFLLIGIGVGASGTSILVLLAERVAERRRPVAATIVWVMMIAGFVVTAGTAGHVLDPYSPERLVAVAAVVSAVAFAVAWLAVLGIESGATQVRAPAPARDAPSFLAALRQVWDEPVARRFTIFVFVSMLAYSMQDLILEPFAGLVFAMTPGESTKLGGLQNGGVLVGMIVVAVIGHRQGGGARVLRGWMVGGCVASALSLAALAFAGLLGGKAGAIPVDIRPIAFLLGLSNGAYAAAAIASMMGLAGDGSSGRDGTRMGLWGAAQAIAFGLGGLAGTVAVDVMRLMTADPALAYGAVFAGEAVLFVGSAVFVAGLNRPARPARSGPAAHPIDGLGFGRS
jgi:BCD family chlorophyll transporter-like MFS transporter